MTLLYILGGMFAGALIYVWAKGSNSFTAFCITESVEWVREKLAKLRSKA